MGLTDLDRHITYVRGYMILHPISQSPEAQPRHIVAHELGHILANTHDEEKAERKGMELLNGQLVAKAP
jgi:Zn-dependent peptidase ImmA (M78 family)